MDFKIVKMERNHWHKVREIYLQGIETGIATFNQKAPDYKTWDKGHLDFGRLIAVKDAQVLGWVALSPTSEKDAYKGSVEVSIYIDESCKGKGIGKALMKEVIRVSEAQGVWSFLSVIIRENIRSITFHESLGFRTIGIREKIAKLKSGEWSDTVLMEYRSKTVGID